jgi:flavin-dependent dehydrogenase
MSRRVLDELGISEFETFGAQQADHIDVIDHDLHSIVSLALGDHVMVDREALDTGLRRRVTARAGAAVMDQTAAMSWTEDNDQIRVIVRRGGATCSLITKILVDASGAAGAIRQFPRVLPTATAIQLWYAPYGNRRRCDWIFDARATPYYQWAIHKPAGLVIGGVFPRSGVRNGQAAIVRMAQSLGVLGTPWRVQAAPIAMPSGACDIRLGHRGALVVGEAAGLINAATGEGISFALRSGLLCGRAIATTVDRGDAARLYARAMSSLIEEVVVKARHAQHMFEPAQRRAMPTERILIPVPRVPLELPR